MINFLPLFLRSSAFALPIPPAPPVTMAHLKSRVDGIAMEWGSELLVPYLSLNCRRNLNVLAKTQHQHMQSSSYSSPVELELCLAPLSIAAGQRHSSPWAKKGHRSSRGRSLRKYSDQTGVERSQKTNLW